jgi:hypothetical protein
MTDDTRTNADATLGTNAALASVVSRGVVSGLGTQGIMVVLDPRDGAREITCDLLDSALRPGEPLQVGDAVLVWASDSPNDRGVVVGRIVAPSVIQSANGPAASAPPARALSLESEDTLVLRVGEGSIEIRADGKVLIRGTDLISHAKRMNRIKGGAVSIN